MQDTVKGYNAYKYLLSTHGWKIIAINIFNTNIIYINAITWFLLCSQYIRNGQIIKAAVNKTSSTTRE